MEVLISIPDQLAEKWADLPRDVLEAFAAQAYRRGKLSSAEVQEVLGLSSRFEVMRFLKEQDVPINYNVEAFEEDRQNWQALGFS